MAVQTTSVPLSMILAYTGAFFFVCLLVDCVLRELKFDRKYRPLYWIRIVGLWIEKLYYVFGIIIGYIWYWSCVVAKHVAEHLSRMVVDTINELVYALRPYFNVVKILEGIKEIALDYWNRYRTNIQIGTAILATILGMTGFWCYIFIDAVRENIWIISILVGVPSLTMIVFISIVKVAFLNQCWQDDDRLKD